MTSIYYYIDKVMKDIISISSTVNVVSNTIAIKSSSPTIYASIVTKDSSSPLSTQTTAAYPKHQKTENENTTSPKPTNA
jgi:hypothetical protein